MGFYDFRHTCLVLGLGLPSPSPSPSPSSTGEDKSRKPSEPTLTLSLSGDTFDRIPPLQKLDFDYRKVASNHDGDRRRSADDNLYGQDHSGGAAASCFSNCSVKREREMGGGEEAEISERFSSRVVSDEDDDNGSINGRKKLRLTKAQSALLEESFKIHSTLNPKQKQELARKLNLRPRQVEVWFQNRRARTKLKQTEVDCEFLKKCCETLTEENQRLQKELHELKALKSPPLYMQFPAATLTVCPSCENISGGGGGLSEKAAKNIPFAVESSKPHFYNPFTNSSAAC